MSIFESLENINVSEGCFNDIVALVEEYINEVSKELADKVKSLKDEKYREAKEKYYKTRDSKDEEEFEKQIVKSAISDELRDKWEVLKGIKRGKDGKLHSHADYKEYKEKYGTK